MVGLLGALGYAELAATVPGLSAVGRRRSSARPATPAAMTRPVPGSSTPGSAPGQHLGPIPRADPTSRWRRPVLRTAAWRAIWGLLPHTPSFAARHRWLTTRTANPLAGGKARAALAAALLRQLWVVFSRRVAWDPALAGNTEEVDAAA